MFTNLLQGGQSDKNMASQRHVYFAEADKIVGYILYVQIGPLKISTKYLK